MNIKPIINKAVMRLLALLGFASTFAFMACYGPAPQPAEEEVIVFDDEVADDDDGLDIADIESPDNTAETLQ